MIAPQIARQKLADNERIIPPHAPGMRIGLFGGTFDPPHQAHLDATLLAMKRLKLDRVWWLVTPGTISWLIKRCPRVQFVWIMGADNLRHFHRWQKWRGIAELIPMVVVDRPGPSLYASASTAGQALDVFYVQDATGAPFGYQSSQALERLSKALEAAARRVEDIAVRLGHA